MAGKPPGARRRDMYFVLDPIAFGAWVRSVAVGAGGPKALVAESFERLRRQGIHEWIGWSRGKRARCEVHADAIEALVLSWGNQAPASLESDGWWWSPPLDGVLLPPRGPRGPARGTCVLLPRQTADEIALEHAERQVPTSEFAAVVSVADHRAFGRHGADRLARGKAPWPSWRAEDWPVRQWIAVHDAAVRVLRTCGSAWNRCERPLTAREVAAFPAAACAIAWRFALHDSNDRSPIASRR